MTTGVATVSGQGLATLQILSLKKKHDDIQQLQQMRSTIMMIDNTVRLTPEALGLSDRV